MKNLVFSILLLLIVAVSFNACSDVTFEELTEEKQGGGSGGEDHFPPPSRGQD